MAEFATDLCAVKQGHAGACILGCGTCNLLLHKKLKLELHKTSETMTFLEQKLKNLTNLKDACELCRYLPAVPLSPFTLFTSVPSLLQLEGQRARGRSGRPHGIMVAAMARVLDGDDVVASWRVIAALNGAY